MRSLKRKLFWAVVLYFLFLVAVSGGYKGDGEGARDRPSTGDAASPRSLERVSLTELAPAQRAHLLDGLALRRCENLAPIRVGSSSASPERYCRREIGLLLLIDDEHTAEEIVDALVSSARPIPGSGAWRRIATRQGYRVIDLEAAYETLGLSRELEAQARMRRALDDDEETP